MQRLLALVTGRLVAVTVSGASMEPTLHDGDRVYAVRRGRAAAPDDLVVFKADERWLIKRVVAVAGGQVPATAVGALPAGETVPSDCLVVVGDNQAASYDSRQFGYLPLERLLGRVLTR